MRTPTRTRWPALALALATTLAALTASAAPATPQPTSPRSPANGTGVSAGWYNLWKTGSPKDGPPRVDNAGGIPGLSLTFTRAYVWPHRGGVPLWIYYSVTYTNHTHTVLYFNCKGLTDPKTSGEHLKRADGSVAGYVGGERTLCSQNPDTVFNLGPARRFSQWVLAHNVPWAGDQVSLEWQRGSNLSVRTPWFRPYVDGPHWPSLPPKDVCPYNCS